MYKQRRENSNQTVRILLLAAGIVLALFLWQGHQHFELWDEGFLWYGAQRVMVGEVPIRDFMAYDPGRYYWSAAFMGLWGDNGIMALRGAVAIFHAIGLFIGLGLLSHSTIKPNRLLWLLAAITLVVWMFPWYKLFDISGSIALVGALSFLVKQPSAGRYFFTGLFVGIIAVFGRNHGVYGVAGSLGVMAYLAVRHENGLGLAKTFAIWAAGVVIGYLPILIMVAVVPGFAVAFWESIRFLFEINATNLPKPMPWPWLVSLGKVPPLTAARDMLLGIFFIAIVVFGVLGIGWVIRQRLQKKPVSPVVVASAFLALPYAHYAYSRADVIHLALGIFPFLIGSFVLLASQPVKIKWPCAVLLCGASLLLMVPLHPGWQCYARHQCVEADVAGSKLKVSPDMAVALEMLKKVDDQFAHGDRTFIVTPFWPGAYAVLKRRSPMWEIYALFPRTEAFEHAEIERIKAANPGFAIIIDAPLDEREELRFRNTHPLVNKYIREHFGRLDGFTPDPPYQLYIGKQTTQ